MKYKFSFLFHSLSFSLFRSTHLLKNFSYKFCMIFNMYCCGNKFLRFTVQPSIQVLYHFLTQLDTVIYAQISKLYPDPKTTIFQHRYDGHTSKLLMQQRQHFITFWIIEEETGNACLSFSICARLSPYNFVSFYHAIIYLVVLVRLLGSL